MTDQPYTGRIEVLNARIAALEAQLAEKEAENERLKRARNFWQSQHDERTRQLGMSGSEATPPAPKVTEAMVNAGRAHYSEGGCMGLDEHEVLEVVEAIIHAALTAAQEEGR